MRVMSNRITLRIALLCFPFLACSFDWAQDHIESGELQGFTRSPEEHIINRIVAPLTVRDVKGSAFIADGLKTPAGGVLFELRGPDDSVTIASTMTKRTGEFHLKHVGPGKYLFKATLSGFQSVVGTIIVSPKAVRDHVVTIEMKVGV